MLHRDGYCIYGRKKYFFAHCGGIVGLNAAGAIVSKSYARGTLTAVAAINYGFAVGENNGTVSACYYDEEMQIVIEKENALPTNDEGVAEQLKVIQTQEFLGKTHIGICRYGALRTDNVLCIDNVKHTSLF